MEDLPKQAVKEQQKDETALVLGTLLKEGDTLTKSHLADVIYEQFGLPKRFCKEIVDRSVRNGSNEMSLLKLLKKL